MEVTILASSTPLKQERERQRLQSKEVATLVGVSDQYYCEIENGRRPSFKLAIRISQVLNRSVDVLFCDHELNESLSVAQQPNES